MKSIIGIVGSAVLLLTAVVPHNNKRTTADAFSVVTFNAPPPPPTTTTTRCGGSVTTTTTTLCSKFFVDEFHASHNKNADAASAAVDTSTKTATPTEGEETAFFVKEVRVPQDTDTIHVENSSSSSSVKNNNQFVNKRNAVEQQDNDETSSTSTRESQQQQETEQQPLLSDLDARVLKSMLQEDKLDLTEEANLKKLLERGVAPKSAPSVVLEDSGSDAGDDESPFASTLFKTLADTKLWKGLKRDAGNILESVGIFVSNRIERDAKLLASVGLFAWERALRDVGRALPAAGTSGAAVGRAVQRAARQLSNSSSFEEMQQQLQQREQRSSRSLQDMDNLYEELNTPMDEIKSVTQSIREILKGETVSTASSARSLRSVAPAGQGSSAERQKRAYRRRKVSTLKQEKEVLNLQRAAGSVIDTAAEVRRELQVESSVPGYRTESARKAIAAGVAETQKLLEAAKRDGWSKALFAATNVTDDTIRQLVGSEDIETVKEEADAQALSQLMEEKSRVVERLNVAIHSPSETWLTAEVVKQMDGAIDENALREVVTAMICARDEWEAEEATNDVPASSAEMVEQLRQVKSTVDSILSLAASCAGMAAAECLSGILYGQDEEGADYRPSLLTLDEVEPSIAAAVEVAETLPDVEVIDEPFVETAADASRYERPQPVDVAFDKDVAELESPATGTAYSPKISAASVEVITDDDFHSAVGAKKVDVPGESEERSGEKKEDVIGFVFLRSLDVAVLVVEKLFTTVIPNAITIGSTVATRLSDVGRNGMGSKGWKTLDNVQSGSKRY